MSRVEGVTVREASAAVTDERLMRELGELPVHGPSADSSKVTSTTARAAFIHTFDDASRYAKALSSVGRAAVPVVLASVVGLYLSWAFAAAIALNQ